MLQFRVKEIAEQKGIANPRVLSEKTGIAYGSCHALWYGNPKFIAVDTLEKLCNALKVKPGQLFDYTPE